MVQYSAPIAIRYIKVQEEIRKCRQVMHELELSNPDVAKELGEVYMDLNSAVVKLSDIIKKIQKL